MNLKRTHKITGFTLLELAIVMLIMSIIAGTVFTLYPIQQSKQIHDDFQARLNAIQRAIDTFVKNNGRLPCPADRTAALNSATFGVETSCSAATATGTAEVAGATANENLRIGALPTRTLNLPDSYMFDPWNYRLDFVAVKGMATTSAAFLAYTTTQADTIRINDLNGNRINQANTVAVPNFLSYVIVSHGQNGSGATTYTGATTKTCTASQADTENCNGDRIYRDTFFNPSSANAFDDYIRWKTYQSLLRDSSLSTGGGSGSGGGLNINDYGVFTHTVSGSVNGGTATAGAWNVRPLNTIQYNTLPSATLSGNRVTLGPGTYFIMANSAAYRVGSHKLQIYNHTTGTSIAVGTGEFSNSAAQNANRSFVSAVFVTATSAQIGLLHFTENSKGNTDLGNSISSSPAPTTYDYAQMQIFQTQ